MVNLIVNTLKILNIKQKLRLAFVSVAGIITGLLEMLSIALFIPLVGLVISKDYLNNFNYLKNFLQSSSNRLNLDEFYVLIIFLIIIFILKNIIILFLNYYSDKSAYDTRKEIGNKIMKNYLLSNYEFYLKKNSSVIFYMLTEEIARFGHMLLSLIRLMTNILITLFIFGFIFYNYPNQLLLLITSAFLGGSLYYVLTRNFILAFGKRRVESESLYIKNLRETLDFLQEIKIYFKENFFSGIYNLNNKTINRNGYIWSFFQTLPKVWFELVAVFSLFLILSFNYSKSLNTEDIIVSLSIMIYAIARTLPSVNIIINSLQNLKFSEYGFNQIKEFINLNPKNIKAEKNPIFEKYSSIELRDLNFDYNKKKEVLNNFNFKIQKGEIVGIIGKSGSGKTTFVNLLIGLLKIKNGNYLFNNKIIHNLNSQQNNLFGYIPQKINLLDDSIKHNITLEFENINSERLKTSIKKAGLDNLISSLDDKENTIVGEKGSSLSGGQAQRIAIARALYNNPEIIVLDEATNSLDKGLEKNILDMLKDLKKTLIIISHDPNTLAICDKIYRLNDKMLTQIK